MPCTTSGSVGLTLVSFNPANCPTMTSPSSGASTVTWDFSDVPAGQEILAVHATYEWSSTGNAATGTGFDDYGSVSIPGLGDQFGTFLVPWNAGGIAAASGAAAVSGNLVVNFGGVFTSSTPESWGGASLSPQSLVVIYCLDPPGGGGDPDPDPDPGENPNSGPPVTGTCQINLSVKDRLTNLGVSGATVQYDGYYYTADASGNLTLMLPSGDYTRHYGAWASGYVQFWGCAECGDTKTAYVIPSESTALPRSTRSDGGVATETGGVTETGATSGTLGGSDTGGGSEGGSQADETGDSNASVIDTGWGSETGTVTAGITGSESGDGSESSSTGTETSASESGTGTETGTPTGAVSGADSASGTDSPNSPMATLTSTESATGSETTTFRATHSFTESGSGTTAATKGSVAVAPVVQSSGATSGYGDDGSGNSAPAGDSSETYFAASGTAGHANIVVLATNDTAGSGSYTISDTQGGTWYRLGTKLFSDGFLQVFYSPSGSALGGTARVHITFPGTYGSTLQWFRVSGLAASPSGAMVTNNGTGTSATLGTVTPSQDSNLVLGIYCGVTDSEGNGDFTLSQGGYTAQDTSIGFTTAGSDLRLETYYKASNTAATATLSGVISSSANWGSSVTWWKGSE